MKIAKFYLVVPIGLEDAAQKELEAWLSVLAVEFGAGAFAREMGVTKGGIEFQLEEQVGFLLNRCLKLPSRILQRLHSFTTREWPVVEKELKSVNWKSLFPQGIRDWEIAASESRMNNEKHLRNFLTEKFAGRFYKVADQNSDKGTVAYLRVHDNVFTLSRDTSGEHLHFRGYRKQQGEAPLRENLAAYLWSLLIEGKSHLDLEKVVIVDPFAGSGTLLFEAWLWNRIINTRTFACDGWLATATLQKWQRVQARLNQWCLHAVGVDVDPDVLKKARQNGQALGINSHLNLISGSNSNSNSNSSSDSDSDSDSDIDWQLEDSTVGGRPQWLPSHQTVWILSNPPYGGKGRLKGTESWRSLWESALKKYQPEWAVGLGPEREARVGDKFSDWECISIQRFLNGGLRVAASVWIRKIRN